MYITVYSLACGGKAHVSLYFSVLLQNVAGFEIVYTYCGHASVIEKHAAES